MAKPTTAKIKLNSSGGSGLAPVLSRRKSVSPHDSTGAKEKSEHNCINIGSSKL